jgi:hypothetical protein
MRAGLHRHMRCGTAGICMQHGVGACVQRAEGRLQRGADGRQERPAAHAAASWQAARGQPLRLTCQRLLACSTALLLLRLNDSLLQQEQLGSCGLQVVRAWTGCSSLGGAAL